MGLTKQLNSIIEDIERSAKTARMISLNAGVIAVRTRSETNEADAFEAIADQIKSISDDSVSRLGSLKAILDDLHELTRTINIAGRQRMLSQSILKLYFIERLEMGASQQYASKRIELETLFMDTLNRLKLSRLSTLQIVEQLNRVDIVWQEFHRAMQADEVARAIRLNDDVLREMNEAVGMYEVLSA